MPATTPMIHNGIQGWIARERDAGRRWVASPEHTWVGAVEVEIDPADDTCLWAKRGSGNLCSDLEGRTADLFSRADLGSCELALEFMIPRGSGAGIFLIGQYEIAIADSADLADAELTPDACGGIRGGRDVASGSIWSGVAPATNAALPAAEWQTLTLLFWAPRFDDEGKKVRAARFEQVTLNDVVIHGRVECPCPSRDAIHETEVARGPLRLRGDIGPVAFRDIRIRTIPE